MKKEKISKPKPKKEVKWLFSTYRLDKQSGKMILTAKGKI